MIQHHWLISSLFVIFMSVTPLLSSDPIEEPPLDIKEITDRGYLRVAMVAKDQAPFFFTNESGEFVGVDVDIANRIASRMGVGVAFDRSSQAFNDLVPKVANGDVDIVISKLSRTITRAKNVIFSTPYVKFRQALMINRIGLARVAPDNNQIANFVKNFTGRIGVIRGSSYVAYASKNFPDAEVVELASWEEVVDAAFSGKVLAAYRDELEIQKILLTNPDASLKVKTIVLSDTRDDIAMAISWKSRQFRDWVNILLESDSINFTSDSIIDQYTEELRKLGEKQAGK